jgi:hypothetical protein
MRKDRRSDGRTEMKELMAAFRNFANALKIDKEEGNIKKYGFMKNTKINELSPYLMN